MEDGYLAKILQGDGAKEIKVGEVSYSLDIHTSNCNAKLLCKALEV